MGLVSPLALIGATILLIIRLGWPGIICPIVIIILLPIQVQVSKKNAKIKEKINDKKDERIKVITEIIEGIKLIKIYGWEFPFKEIVDQIRKQ